MTLQTSTDPDVVRTVATRAVALDPVANTVFGTAPQYISAERSCWCAWDGPSFAVRSDAPHPVAVTAWPAVDALAAALPAGAGVSGPTETVERLTAGWSIERRDVQRLFRCDRLIEPVVSGAARPATEADFSVLTDLWAGFIAAQGESWDAADAARRSLAAGTVWLWEQGGRVVSIARAQPTAAGSARIGPVYTPPEHRGHGYASAATAAATRDILTRPALPVLFTDLANPVSNAIYPRLGYEIVTDYLRVFPASGTST